MTAVEQNMPTSESSSENYKWAAIPRLAANATSVTPISQTHKIPIEPSKETPSFFLENLPARNIGRTVMGLCWMIFLRLMPVFARLGDILFYGFAVTADHHMVWLMLFF
jgi:hypothetical protein